jgi:hypothetical protein
VSKNEKYVKKRREIAKICFLDQRQLVWHNPCQKQFRPKPNDMKYNTPKELWNLYKELVAFKKQKQDIAQMDSIVFEHIKAHLNDKQIKYSVGHPDNMIQWQVAFDDARSGLIFYYQDGSDFVLDSYCYTLKEPDAPIDYVRFSNVFNSLLHNGSLYYFSERNVLRYKAIVSIREFFWEPQLIEHRLYQHYSIANDISRCAHDMHNTGKDAFDVVADFMSQRNQESAS